MKLLKCWLISLVLTIPSIVSIRAAEANRITMKSDSEVIFRLHLCFTAIDSGGFIHVKDLAKERPAETREAIMAAISLESGFFEKSPWEQLAFPGWVRAAAMLYGHEPECYQKLRDVMEAGRKLEWPESVPESQRKFGPMGGAVFGAIVWGLGVDNGNDGALDNLVDLIESGMLSTPSPYGGSRGEAYNTLVDRYQRESDAAKRLRILKILAHYSKQEPDSGTRSSLNEYLKTTGIAAAIVTMEGTETSRWTPPKVEAIANHDQSSGAAVVPEPGGGIAAMPPESPATSGAFVPVCAGAAAALLLLVACRVFRRRKSNPSLK